jgi:hypothetical protein
MGWPFGPSLSARCPAVSAPTGLAAEKAMGTTPAATLTSQLDNESRTKQMGQVGRCPPAPFLTETHNASGAQLRI